MAATTAPTFEPTTTALTDPDTVLGLDYAEPGAMYPDWRGINYDRSLSTKDIAAAVRRELRKRVKDGTLGSATAVSVRYESYSGGSSIHVTLTVPKEYVDADTPGAVEMRDRWGDLRWVIDHGDGYPASPEVYASRVEPGARDAKAKAEAFLATFNHNRSDVMTDYFDVKFYSDVTFKVAP